jgi:16S rRNA G966 N2-methylase RsmD
MDLLWHRCQELIKYSSHLFCSEEGKLLSVLVDEGFSLRYCNIVVVDPPFRPRKGAVKQQEKISNHEKRNTNVIRYRSSHRYVSSGASSIFRAANFWSTKKYLI